MADARTRRRAEKARDKIEKMIREITAWKNERPKIVRVNMGDYLALTEMGYIKQEEATGDMVVSGMSPRLEVKPG